MAFTERTWLGGVDYLGGSNRLHGYTSNDALAVTNASGYFNTVAAQLRKGDVIQISADLDGTPAAQQVMVTSADFATTVTVVAAT